MRTEKEIRDRIKSVEKSYDHVLTGSFADIMTKKTDGIIILEIIER